MKVTKKPTPGSRRRPPPELSSIECRVPCGLRDLSISRLNYVLSMVDY